MNAISTTQQHPRAKEAAQPAQKPAEKRMSLSKVRSGKLPSTARVLIYGTEGVGKSTFGADAPNPIFLCVEGGTNNLDVDRLPQPQRWSEVQEAVDELIKEGHDYKTFVIDTIDALDGLIFRHVIASASIGSNGARPSTIDEVGGGFGKGHNAALDCLSAFLRKLEILQSQRQLHVVLIGHAAVKTIKNPEGDDYDMYMVKM